MRPSDAGEYEGERRADTTSKLHQDQVTNDMHRHLCAVGESDGYLKINDVSVTSNHQGWRAVRKQLPNQRRRRA